MAAVTPVQSTLLSARGICELALQKVGAYSVNDEGADHVEMVRSLDWLDLIIAEIAGTDQCVWLVPATISFTWPASTRSDSLADLAGAAYPPTGILYPKSARLRDSNGVLLSELTMLTRQQYENMQDKDDEGQPDSIYIDRLADDAEVSASIYRVPGTDPVYTVDLVVQAYAASVRGTQGDEDQAGNVRHGFSQEWQRFIVNRLAADIGDGPVRRLDQGTLDKWRAEAAVSFSNCQVYSNREKRAEFDRPRTRRWGA